MVLIKNLIIAILGLAIALVLYAILKSGNVAFMPQPKQETPTSTPTVPQVHLITYRNDTYGLQFMYPEGYVMREIDASTPERMHRTITLLRREDTPIPENGEGPTAITIDIYQNDRDHRTLNEWLQTSSSNFKLGSGSYASTTISGSEAVQYRWSGLYEGETTAFLHASDIVAVSVTYLSPEDENVAVYRQLLATLTLN